MHIQTHSRLRILSPSSTHAVHKDNSSSRLGKVMHETQCDAMRWKEMGATRRNEKEIERERKENVAIEFSALNPSPPDATAINTMCANTRE
mmetsp:Transcript_10606/g.29245  ORF Transcript_10606/g.29245 Transcript_10606/m.29245 type:complete len:91 (+) Transcript_10606:454-726(+)